MERISARPGGTYIRTKHTKADVVMTMVRHSGFEKIKKEKEKEEEERGEWSRCRSTIFKMIVTTTVMNPRHLIV